MQGRSSFKEDRRDPACTERMQRGAHRAIGNQNLRAPRLERRSRSGAGVSVFSQGSIDWYWAKIWVRSGTRSLITDICGNG